MMTMGLIFSRSFHSRVYNSARRLIFTDVLNLSRRRIRKTKEQNAPQEYIGKRERFM